MDRERAPRMVFMGTPAFAVPALEALMAGGYDLVGVYTQPDRPSGRGRGVVSSPIKSLALESGLRVYQPPSLKDVNAREELKALRPEVMVVAAYGLILPLQVLDIPPHGTVNVHPSLLPRHRGPSPVASTILEGDEVTGVTIMLASPRVDAGPVLSAAQVKIEADATTGTLTEILSQVGADLLVETLPRWLRGEIQPQPQDEAQATYSRMLSKRDGEIDWRLPASEIWRRVRALDPWPGTYTRWQGRLLKVLEVEPLPDDRGAEPGRVVQAKEMGRQVQVVVGTGEGTLLLKRVQLEGRRAVEGGSFVIGHRDFVGSLLPS
ncbi:MAG: methionyl-tRNA formyltransferase [Dehalococcoidia bacterium]